MIERGGASRFRVLDCWISCVDMPKAAEYVRNRIGTGEGGYVCFSNVHTVVTARRDHRLREITNASFLSLPDGKPLSVVGRLLGVREVGHVAGPDFMPYFLQTAMETRHFFYGSSEETLQKLEKNLASRFPGARIVGTYSPPFRNLSADEENEIVSIVNRARPDVIWVGLGAPKQEYWMAEHWRRFKPALLMGVGAAFDFHAGQIARAPEWMKGLSLEWLFRLKQEPRRLWKRYLVTNSLFLFYLLSDRVRRSENRPRVK